VSGDSSPTRLLIGIVGRFCETPVLRIGVWHRRSTNHLLMVSDGFYWWLLQFELGARLLELCCLLFQASSERFDCWCCCVAVASSSWTLRCSLRNSLSNNVSCPARCDTKVVSGNRGVNIYDPGGVALGGNPPRTPAPIQTLPLPVVRLLPAMAPNPTLFEPVLFKRTL
jgi:hypothetical protein